jgi:hypothetical protein
MRPIIFLGLLIGTVYAASVADSNDTDDERSVESVDSCPCDREPEIDHVYSKFISSPTYLRSIHSKLISDECFRILATYYGSDSPPEEGVIEGALMNVEPTIPLVAPIVLESPHASFRHRSMQIDDGHQRLNFFASLTE